MSEWYLERRQGFGLKSRMTNGIILYVTVPKDYVDKFQSQHLIRLLSISPGQSDPAQE
jgi:hypothetical protein